MRVLGVLLAGNLGYTRIILLPVLGEVGSLISRTSLEEFEGPRYERIAHLKKLLADGVLGANLRRQKSSRGGDQVFAVAAKL
jgi:hypothetical protein